MRSILLKLISCSLSALIMLSSCSDLFAQAAARKPYQGRYNSDEFRKNIEANNQKAFVAESTYVHNPELTMARSNNANNSAKGSFLAEIEVPTKRAAAALEKGDAKTFAAAVDQINYIAIASLGDDHQLVREEALALLISNLSHNIISAKDRQTVFNKSFAYLAEHKSDNRSNVQYFDILSYNPKDYDRPGINALMVSALILSSEGASLTKLIKFYRDTPIYYNEAEEYPEIGKPSTKYNYPSVKNNREKYLAHLISSVQYETKTMDAVYSLMSSAAFEEYVKAMMIRKLNKATFGQRSKRGYKKNNYEIDIAIVNSLPRYGKEGERLIFNFINNYYTKASWVWANINGAYTPSAQVNQKTASVIKKNLYEIYCYDYTRIDDPNEDMLIKQEVSRAYYSGAIVKAVLRESGNTSCAISYPTTPDQQKVIQVWKDAIGKEIAVTLLLSVAGPALRPIAAYISVCAKASKVRVLTLYQSGQRAIMANSIKSGVSGVNSAARATAVAQKASNTLQQGQKILSTAAESEAALQASQRAAAAASRAPKPKAFETPYLNGKVDEGEIVRRFRSTHQEDIAWRRAFFKSNGILSNGKNYSYYKKLSNTEAAKTLFAVKEAELYAASSNQESAAYRSISGDLDFIPVSTDAAALRGAPKPSSFFKTEAVIEDDIAETVVKNASKNKAVPKKTTVAEAPKPSPIAAEGNLRYIAPKEINNFKLFTDFYATLTVREQNLLRYMYRKGDVEAVWGGFSPQIKSVLSAVAKDANLRIKFFNKLEQLYPIAEAREVSFVAAKQARIAEVKKFIEANTADIRLANIEKQKIEKLAKAAVGDKTYAAQLKTAEGNIEALKTEGKRLGESLKTAESTLYTKIEYESFEKAVKAADIDMRNLRLVIEVNNFDREAVEAMMHTIGRGGAKLTVGNDGAIVIGDLASGAEGVTNAYSALLGCSAGRPCSSIFRGGAMRLYSPDKGKYIRITTHEYTKKSFHLHLYDVATTPGVNVNYAVTVRTLDGVLPSSLVRKNLLLNSIKEGATSKSGLFKALSN